MVLRPDIYTPTHHHNNINSSLSELLSLKISINNERRTMTISWKKTKPANNNCVRVLIRWNIPQFYVLWRNFNAPESKISARSAAAAAVERRFRVPPSTPESARDRRRRLRFPARAHAHTRHSVDCSSLACTPVCRRRSPFRIRAYYAHITRTHVTKTFKVTSPEPRARDRYTTTTTTTTVIYRGRGVLAVFAVTALVLVAPTER